VRWGWRSFLVGNDVTVICIAYVSIIISMHNIMWNIELEIVAHCHYELVTVYDIEFRKVICWILTFAGFAGLRNSAAQLSDMISLEWWKLLPWYCPEDWTSWFCCRVISRHDNFFLSFLLDRCFGVFFITLQSPSCCPTLRSSSATIRR